MVLPELYGFSNSLGVSQSSSNLRTDPKSSLMFSLSSVRRLYTNYMLSLGGSVGSEGSNLEVSFDRVCENNLHLKLSPICINNGKLGNPKIAVDKSFKDLQFSAITDISSTNFEFSESNHKKWSRSMKVYIEGANLGVMPKVEWQMAERLRMFVQLTMGINFSTQEQNISIHPSLTYGYKLLLTEDLKLELASSIGYPNYFQVSLFSSKFRVSIPFATSDAGTIY